MDGRYRILLIVLTLRFGGAIQLGMKVAYMAFFAQAKSRWIKTKFSKEGGMRKSEKVLSVIGVMAAPLVFSLLPVVLPNIGVVLAVILASGFFGFFLAPALLVAVLAVAAVAGLISGGQGFITALF